MRHLAFSDSMLYNQPMIKQIHIFDLDGTLVDSSHRYRTMWNGSKLTIDFPHWLENENLYHLDTTLPLVEQYRELNKNPDVYTIWITARNLRHFEESKLHLFSILGRPNKWFCRPNGNMESGAVLKTRQLGSFLNLRQFAKADKWFYEDNKSYLDTVCSALGINPVFIPSVQGH